MSFKPYTEKIKKKKIVQYRLPRGVHIHQVQNRLPRGVQIHPSTVQSSLWRTNTSKYSTVFLVVYKYIRVQYSLPHGVHIYTSSTVKSSSQCIYTTSITVKSSSQCICICIHFLIFLLCNNLNLKPCKIYLCHVLFRYFLCLLSKSCLCLIHICLVYVEKGPYLKIPCLLQHLALSWSQTKTLVQAPRYL